MDQCVVCDANVQCAVQCHVCSAVQCSVAVEVWMDQWRAKQRTTAFNSIVPLFTPYLQDIYKEHYDDDDYLDFEGDADGDINL